MQTGALPDYGTLRAGRARPLPSTVLWSRASPGFRIVERALKPRSYVRMVRIRFCLLVGAAIAGVCSAAASADVPPDPAALAACIAANQARYDVPSNAVLSQYISLVDACRAALTHETDVHVSLTPIGHAAAKSKVGAAPPAATSFVQAPSELPHLFAPPPSRTKPHVRTIHAPVASHADQKAALSAVKGAVYSANRDRSLAATVPSGTPWQLILLGIAAIGALVAVGFALRRR